jgi:hypothetical protein
VTISSALVVISIVLGVCENGGGAGIILDKKKIDIFVIITEDILNVKSVF